MNQKENYYQILGISSSSTTKQIKSAFKTQIKKYHPDKNATNDFKIQEEFYSPANKEISIKIIQAYQFLMDPEKRKTYDQQLYNESLKYQIVSTRHKDTISLSTINQEINENLDKDSFETMSGNINFIVKGYKQQEGYDMTIFVCQQCFGQTQIPNKELQEIETKQLSINCQNCGLYINIVE